MLEGSNSDASDPGDEGGASVQGREITAGAALFARLRTLGVDYVFCNSGTDFPPIIEGLAEASAGDVPLPEAIVIPHEHAALGMAHGYYFATGKAQAVILHTNVGLANGAIGAINAATDRVPVILMSGRTPVTEKGRFGARTVPIGWGQEMRDQAALVREACKWDYELRFPEQIGELLDRAHAIASSTPKGPVYLSLPREVLCQTLPAAELTAPPSMMPARMAADQRTDRYCRELAVASASNPLVIAQRGAGSEDGFAALSRLLEEWSIPICQWWAVATAVPTDHRCHVGSNPQPWIGEADVVLVIDSMTHGRRMFTSRESTPGSSISGRTRCSRAFRSATSGRICRSPAKQTTASWLLKQLCMPFAVQAPARRPGVQMASPQGPQRSGAKLRRAQRRATR